MKKKPCEGCDFEKLSKDRPECRNCDDRLAHAASVELSGAAMPSSSMVWNAGFSAATMSKEINEIKEIYMEKSKECSKCGKEKLLNKDNFYSHKLTLDGYEGQCKECRKIHMALTARRRYAGRLKKTALSVEPAPASSPESVIPDAEEPITLDFSKHPHLLDGIKTIADEQFRSVKQQIMWVINQALCDGRSGLNT